VLTARALKKFKDFEASGDLMVLDKFSDKGDIFEYALESMTEMVGEGLIEGSGGRVYPRDNTARAEAAVFLYRIYNRINKYRCKNRIYFRPHKKMRPKVFMAL